MAAPQVGGYVVPTMGRNVYVPGGTLDLASNWQKKLGLTIHSVNVTFTDRGMSTEITSLIDENGCKFADDTTEVISVQAFKRRNALYNRPSEAENMVSFCKRMGNRLNIDVEKMDGFEPTLSWATHYMSGNLTFEQRKILGMSQKAYSAYFRRSADGTALQSSERGSPAPNVGAYVPERDRQHGRQQLFMQNPYPLPGAGGTEAQRASENKPPKADQKPEHKAPEEQSSKPPTGGD